MEIVSTDALSSDGLPLQKAESITDCFSALDSWIFGDLRWKDYLKGVAFGFSICIVAYQVRKVLREWNAKKEGGSDMTRQAFLNGSGARSRLHSSRYRRLRGNELGMADQRPISVAENSLRFSDTSFVSDDRNEPLINANGNGIIPEIDLTGLNTSHELMSLLRDVDLDSQVKKQEGQHLMTLLFHIGEDQSKREHIRHNGFSCNICEANPLTGIRYKCANCNDFDVCERCEASCEHDLTHVFLKIKTPIPPLAVPRSSLLPKFYPGNPSLHGPLSWQEVLNLKEQTYFEIADIECLFEKYISLCNDKKGISRDVYYQCLGPLGTQKNLVLDQIFKFYDSNNNGYIDFEEFTIAISLISRGTHEEKLWHVFEGYDVDKDGFISSNELYMMLSAYYHINVELLKDIIKSCEESFMTNYENLADKPISSIFKAPIPVDSTGGSGENDSGKRNGHHHHVSSSNGAVEEDRASRWTEFSPTSKETFNKFPVVEAMVKDAIKEMVSGIMADADTDQDGRLSFEEFAVYSSVDVSLLSWFEEFTGVF